RVLEYLDDVNRLLIRLCDDLAVVLTQTVISRTTLNQDAGRRHVADGDRVVLARHDRLGEITPDLLGVHVKGGGELDVAHVVGAELDVHEARHPARRVCVLVVLHALDEGTRTVPDAHNGYPHRTHIDVLLIFQSASAG